MASYSKLESIRRKKKGFKFEVRVCRMILEVFHKYLGIGDAKPTPMGNNGEDIILSDKATTLLPISLECKDHKNRYGGTYDIYEQAKGNASEGEEPVGVFTDSFNKRPVLAVMDFHYYLNLKEELATLKQENKIKTNGTLKHMDTFVPISINKKEIVATVTVY